MDRGRKWGGGRWRGIEVEVEVENRERRRIRKRKRVSNPVIDIDNYSSEIQKSKNFKLRWRSANFAYGCAGATQKLPLRLGNISCEIEAQILPMVAIG